MDYIIQFIKRYIVDPYMLMHGDMYTIISLCFKVLLFIAVAIGIIAFLLYLHKYKIIEMFFLRIKKDIYAYDRLRRKQMKAEIEAHNELFSSKSKISILSRIYDFIAKSGIIEKVPAFSEAMLLIVFITFSAILFILIGIKRNFMLAIIMVVALWIVSYYVLSLLIYLRRTSVERQLLEFTNACASASRQYSNFVDICGSIYDQFTGVLRDALEACYVEAKQTNNTELALEHLKRKINSRQFLFVVNNFELCSSITGNYYEAARDISEIISIYNKSYEKKMALLRNARINILVLFAISIAVLYSLGQFTGNVETLFFKTNVGAVALILMIVILFYGLNIKPGGE